MQKAFSLNSQGYSSRSMQVHQGNNSTGEDVVPVSSMRAINGDGTQHIMLADQFVACMA
jgi:hypothetical protein